MASFQVTPPDQFDFKKTADFEKWFVRFERFKTASGLSEKSQEQQVNALVYWMGKEADDVLKSFGLSDEEQKVYTTDTGKYVNYFNVRRNTIFERARFNLRKQEEGVCGSIYYIIYTLEEHFDYGELKDQLIWDRIVVGLRDAKISEKLQLDPALTLEKAVTQARQKEAVHEQKSIVRSYVLSENKIDSVKF